MIRLIKSLNLRYVEGGNKTKSVIVFKFGGTKGDKLKDIVILPSCGLDMTHFLHESSIFYLQLG